jgi:hypothetical protein
MRPRVGCPPVVSPPDRAAEFFGTGLTETGPGAPSLDSALGLEREDAAR